MPASSQTRVVAIVVAAAFFMQNLDSTVIVTAIPAIAQDFGRRPVDLSIGITAYLLATAVFLPMSSWLADRIGARTVFAAAVALFSLASLGCALSTDLNTFVVARVLQGIGGAMMAPVGRIVVLRNTSKSDLLEAIALISWPGLVAPVIGPLVGGLITTYWSWHGIFLLNVPLGALGVWAVLRYIPDVRATSSSPFDYKGFLLVSAATGLLVYGLEAIGQSTGGAHTNWSLIAALLAMGLISGLLAVRHLTRHPAPILDLRPFSVPTFNASVLGAGMAVRVAISATPFLLPLYFQFGYGMSAVGAGAMILFYFGGNLVMKAATTWILHKWGFKPVLVGNGFAIALTTFAFLALGPTTPVVLTAMILLASGLARSMQFTSLATIAFADVDDDMRSVSSTLSSVLFQLAQVMGVALGALLLGLGQVTSGSSLPTLVDFQPAFIGLGLLAVVSSIMFLRLAPDAGAEISGHARAR